MMLNKSEHIKDIFHRLWDDGVHQGFDLPESAKESVWLMVISVCFELDNEHQTELAAANARIKTLEAVAQYGADLEGKLHRAEERIELAQSAIEAVNNGALSQGAGLIAIATAITPQPPLTPEVIAMAKELDEKWKREHGTVKQEETWRAE